MTTTVSPAAYLLAHLQLRIGQQVHVNRNASWFAATVTALTPRAVGVAYAGGPANLTRTVAPWAVRPADGVLLRPARRLGAGDEVLFGATVRTVAAPPRKSGGWLDIPFTDGEPARLLPGAVMRLRDTTPTVTVNGLPLAQALTR